MKSTESLPTTQPEVEQLAIAGITQPTIIRYFETLNIGDFEACVALFAADGVMHPPFESGIVGWDAILTYLQREAQDLTTYPREGIVETLATNEIQIQVTGKVSTSWCGVNVSWLFILNPQQEITYTKIKLLASPQELLNLRQ